jgi:hypothetical protein
MPVRRSRRLRKRTDTESAPVIHFRSHPWHGLELGPEPPHVLNAFEVTPFDLMKYEVDGLQMIDGGEADQSGRAKHPLRVVRAAMADYAAAFPDRAEAFTR